MSEQAMELDAVDVVAIAVLVACVSVLFILGVLS